ncbi:MAG: helix-turn-helix domain-containing protein [Rhodospirillales bacterium]
MSERQAESYQDNTGSAGQRAGSDSGVSAMLRASRMRIGEDLRDVANILRIRYRYLEDIEEGRFDDLPGNTYAIGFIRSYADHLGLDGEEVVRRFKEEAAALKGEPTLEFPAPISESGIPAGALMFVGVVIAVLAYGAWYIGTSEKNYIAELISPLPDRLAKMLPEEERKATAPAPAAAPVSSSAEMPVTPPGVAASAGKPEEEKTEKAPDSAEATDATLGGADPSAESSGASNVTPAPEVASPESASPEAASSEAASSATAPETPAAASPSAVAEPARTETAEESASAAAPPRESSTEKPSDAVAEAAAPKTENAAAPEKAAPAPEQAAPAPEKTVAARATGGRIYGVENEGARIVLRAKMNSWIQVRDDVANQLLLTRLLRQGDSYRVPNRGGLKLLAGNAGALEILVDGKAVPPIGPQGAVRRSVMLDAMRLQQGKAVVE